MFRVERPKSRFDAAICSSLLAPDALHSASPTDFEYVSGGCWSEDLKATVVTPRDSFELGYPRSSFGSRQDLQCSNYETEECAGIADVIGPVWYRNLESIGHNCAHGFESETRCVSSHRPHSVTRLGQASANIRRDPTSINSSAGHTGLKCDRTHLEQSSELEYDDASRRLDPLRDFTMQNVLHMMQTSGQEDGAYKSDMRSDTKQKLHALPAESAPASISTDTISITASSAVLSPAMMPRVVCGGRIADGGSDCDSLEIASAYSVEADEMIGTQSRAWKHLLRDVLHRARLIRGSKGQKTDGPKGSFTV